MVTPRRMMGFFVLLVLAALIGWGGYAWCCGRSPEARIRNVLISLEENASRSSGEKLPAGIIKNQALGNLFAPSSSLQFRTEMFSGEYTPSELTANAARLRLMFSSLKIGVSDIQIDLLAPTEAVAYFTGTLKGRLKTGAFVDEVRDLSCKFVELDGEWKIKSMMIREVLEK